jgi:hypothetical protein
MQVCADTQCCSADLCCLWCSLGSRALPSNDVLTCAEYTGDVDEWRDNEPKNAHAHILSILLSSSLSIPVHERQLALGPWQSVIMVRLRAAEAFCGWLALKS